MKHMLTKLHIFCWDMVLHIEYYFISQNFKTSATTPTQEITSADYCTHTPFDRSTSQLSADGTRTNTTLFDDVNGRRV